MERLERARCTRGHADEGGEISQCDKRVVEGEGSTLAWGGSGAGRGPAITECSGQARLAAAEAAVPHVEP